MAKKQITTKKKKEVKNVSAGRLYVTATFNNTLITLTDTKGQAIAWSSSGNAGFKGTRKATPFAAITAVEKVAQAAKTVGMSTIEVYLKGPGPGRDAAIRALRNSGMTILMIADVTPIPFNGPRGPVRRRV
jgi:small subunit ribosomal protein S11